MSESPKFASDSSPGPGRAARLAAHGVTFFVHLVPRFVTDFGAVARYLVSHRIPAAIYSLKTGKGSSAGWADPEMEARYLASLPKAAVLRWLPLDRERIGLIGALRTCHRAYSLARRGAETVFVFWTVIPILVCGLPFRLFRRPCVFLVTGLGSTFSPSILRYRLVRPIVTRMYAYLFSGRLSRVIVHNHEDKDFLCRLGVPASHVAVTPGCGVDPAEFPFSTELPRNSRKIILVPVRLLREKGILDAARASTLLLEKGIEHEMWFSSSIDPGNPSALTPKEIRQVQQDSPCIRFVGYQPSLVPLYHASDVVCIPTRYREGLPTALLEAAACGRPIVATDNVGCREFIQDGETGLMAPCGSPSRLADALARVLTDPSLAEQLRRNAYARYRSGFTKAAMVATTIDVMQELGLDVPSPRPELSAV
jgi:glycosyltransferase involved in cell wall biosynthesis